MLMTLCQRGQRSGEAHGNRNLLLLEVTTSETELRQLVTTLVRLVEEITNAIAITSN